MIPPLAGYTARVQQALRESQPFGALVEKLRSGPPVWSLLGLPVVRDRANLHEFFIHHEDVRRAQPGWSVRDLPPETRDEHLAARAAHGPAAGARGEGHPDHPADAGRGKAGARA